MLEGEPLAVRQRKLRARVARHLPAADVDRIAEFLGEITATPFGASESLQLRAARQDALLMGDQVQRAFVEFVAAECETRPLLIVFEDLHYGDFASVKLLDATLRALPESALMVLAFGRTEMHERFPQLFSELSSRRAQQVVLGELTPKRSAKLVREVLGDSATEAQVARIVERAQGNAFFLEELIRAFAEGHGSGHGSQGVDGAETPETVLAMLQGRLDRLPADVRRVLRAASVFGEIFYRRGVYALLGDEPQARVDRCFSLLLEREVIRRRSPTRARFPDVEELAFAHELVREAAYAMLTAEDRALGHRLAAEWLESLGEEEAIVLAEHAERGADAKRARRFYLRAAAQALSTSDLPEAIERAGLAIALGAEGEDLGALSAIVAEAHRWRGEHVLAREAGKKALDLLRSGSEAWFSAAAEVGLAEGRLGDVEGLGVLKDRLLALGLDTQSPASAIIAWARTSAQLLLAGEREVAEGLFAHIESVAPAFASDPSLSARLALIRAMRALFAGDAGGYRQHTTEAAEAFLRAGDQRAACMQRASVGYASLGLGDHGYAVDVLRESLATARRMGLRSVAAYAQHNFGLALALLASEGPDTEARAIALRDALKNESEALEALEKQGDSRLALSARLYRARIQLLRGEVARAAEDVRWALKWLDERPDEARRALPLRPLALGVAAQVALTEGDAVTARARAMEAIALVKQLGHVEEGEGLVRLVVAEALAAAGEREAAESALDEAARVIVARAEKIADPSLRRNFLDRVPEHRRTRELADAWQRPGVRTRS